MSVTVLGSHVLEVVARTFVIYVVMFIGLRFFGKREIGQFTVFDLVMILLIANAVQNAMVGPDTSLFGGVVAALTLLVVNWGVGMATGKSKTFRELTLGTPTLLVSDGKTLDENMKNEQVTEEELIASMREHGVDKISEVSAAWLEVDGEISIIPKGANRILRTQKKFRFLRRKQ